MIVKVNHEFCTGCGPCEKICPAVFKIENNLCRVQIDTVPQELIENCLKAVEQCPVEAIMMEPQGI